MSSVPKTLRSFLDNLNAFAKAIEAVDCLDGYAQVENEAKSRLEYLRASQDTIIKDIADAKAEIAAIKANAQLVTYQAKQDAEAMILSAEMKADEIKHGMDAEVLAAQLVLDECKQATAAQAADLDDLKKEYYAAYDDLVDAKGIIAKADAIRAAMG